MRAAEDAWNTRDRARVVLAYTPDSRWRNRVEFPNGREEIQAFLTRKWVQELDYRLIKELWIFAADRIAVRFAYEYRDDSGHWFRAYGNENWRFDADGLMAMRFASTNEHPIAEAERQFRWPLGLALTTTRASAASASDAKPAGAPAITARSQKEACHNQVALHPSLPSRRPVDVDPGRSNLP